jgi:Amidohydrolase
MKPAWSAAPAGHSAGTPLFFVLEDEVLRPAALFSGCAITLAALCLFSVLLNQVGTLHGLSFGIADSGFAPANWHVRAATKPDANSTAGKQAFVIAAPNSYATPGEFFPPPIDYLALTDVKARSDVQEGPGIQALPSASQAITVARHANDHLAEQVAKNPKRLKGFAALPLQDPEAAAQELTGCVKNLGFCSALVNGFTQTGEGNAVAFYDLPPYRDFWATVQQLDVPFYLHPRSSLPSQQPIR